VSTKILRPEFSLSACLIFFFLLGRFCLHSRNGSSINLLWAGPERNQQTQAKQTTSKAMAGVQVSSEAVNTYNQLRFGKGGMKYFTCKLSSDMTEVVVDTIGSSTASWEEMEAALPKNECRYVFFHFDYEHDGGKRYVSFLLSFPQEG